VDAVCAGGGIASTFDMALNGQARLHFIQPVHGLTSFKTQVFVQPTRSRLKRCKSQAATHRPQPVQRELSISATFLVRMDYVEGQLSQIKAIAIVLMHLLAIYLCRM
jgi:hypothetical protein